MPASLITSIPGPKSRALAARLRRVECQNVTYLAEDWPIFWKSAKGNSVWDVDGNRFIDLTSAFGVAGLGHGPDFAINAMTGQARELLHAMGDVHPTELKVELCEKLAAMTFVRWSLGHAKVTLCNSGFEAVETALKTAYLATGKRGILGFKSGYHGLGYGALLPSGMDKFRQPFGEQLPNIAQTLQFPATSEELREFEAQLEAINVEEFGAVVVEPILGRGGKIVPVQEFHQILRTWCDTNEIILIHDEIYSGFYRSGKLFASDHWGIRPDLLCVGKAMSSGFPISACIGKSSVMDQWPVSSGEALHTSTFLGHPVGCAMALASLKELDHVAVAEKVVDSGHQWKEALEAIGSPLIHEIRGRGLMLGIELRHTDGSPAGDVAGQILSQFLSRGIIALADGVDGNVLAITPPFDFPEEDLEFVVNVLGDILHHL